MAVELRMSEEELLKGIKQSNQSVEMCKKDQRWLYLLVIGSFGLLVAMNYNFPNLYPIEKKPIYDANYGFLGLVLTGFGISFFFNAIFFRSIGEESIIFFIFTWLIGAVLCVFLLYYGFPLFFGFEW